MIAKRLGAALKGRAWWMRLKREFGVDDGVYVILMPEDDAELNELALRHIGDLVAHRRARGVVIVTYKKKMEEAAANSEHVIAVVSATEKEIDGLLSFYELYAFTERLLIVSLTKPFGSNLHKAVGINGVTKEDLVCLGIFLIRDWERQEAANG